MDAAVGAHIRIPARSALAYEPQVLSDYRINVPFAHNPIWQQVAVPAQLRDKTAQPEGLTDYLKRELDLDRPVHLSTAAAAQLAAASDTESVVACLEYGPAAWEVSSLGTARAEHALGAAVDIGTTTVVLLLVDLVSGKILARAADFNQQMQYGDDVITRVTLCTGDAAAVDRLRTAVGEKTLARLLERALAGAGMAGQSLVCMTIAGNTTMLHLAAGIDPSPLGVVPFTPVFLEHRRLRSAALLGVDQPIAGADFPIHLLPSAAAYVGADLTAGIFASGLAYDDGPSLLVDVGTNGEIIFKHGDKLLGCATAAGPAFEGAGLSCGMRAGAGAIAYLEFSRTPFAITPRLIGGTTGNGGGGAGGAATAAAGLCGSAYVDFLAEARRIGLLNTMGRFDVEAVPGAAPHVIPYKSCGSIDDRALVVGYGQGRRPIVVTESDVARLLAAKAAVAAGIKTLMNRAGVKAEEIQRVYLAGGFGTHMSARNAIRCGLLPGFRPEQIMPVGNTSAAGAYLALMDSGAFDEIVRIAQQVETIELNTDPEFEGCYIDELCLPDPE
jgi:uncharacterized 2Fe-2S/4Fe-4S cluster protein (DUF4445 family)